MLALAAPSADLVQLHISLAVHMSGKLCRRERLLVTLLALLDALCKSYLQRMLKKQTGTRNIMQEGS
jgi:hypothetical protein